MKRLRTDYIDLYFQHRIDPGIPAEEVAGVMQDLIREGKVLHWGISEADEEYLRRANAVCPVTAVENRYSMMARHYETLFPVLEELGVGFVAFSPMANGLLSGQKHLRKTANCLRCSGKRQKRKVQLPAKLLLHGCFVKNRGSCRFRERAGMNA